MRVELAGAGQPIPLEALPDLTDLGDSVTLIFEANDDFEKVDWVALGFTHAEIICVGAAGGRGGKSNFQAHLDYEIFTLGGSGGGGGLEVVTIPLVDLPDSCPVVVGLAGADGADGVYSYGAYGGSDGHGTLDRGDPGTNGGYSTFNGTVCRASGGKGGLAPPANNPKAAGSANNSVREIPPSGDRTTWIVEARAGGNGGQGGKGGQIAVGGGAEGGKSLPGGYSPFIGSTDNTPQTLIAPETGSWDGHIGEGGGGGMGGTFGLYNPAQPMFAV